MRVFESFSGILDVVCLDFLGGTDGGAGVGEHCCGRKQLPQALRRQHAADTATAREPGGRVDGVARGEKKLSAEIDSPTTWILW